MMKNRALYFILILLVACVHKAPTTIKPAATKPVGESCDSNDISYLTSIKPIFRNNCYSCHNDSVTHTAEGQGLDLEDTSSLKNYLKYDFQGDGIYGSRLYHCLLHSFGALQMPPAYTIDSCSLKKIRNWLSHGAHLN